MPIYEMLGLYPDPETSADAVEQLHKIDVPDANITILSGIPYKSEMFGRPAPRHWIGRAALTGAVIGLIAALGLTIGIYALYTLNVGNQPRLFPVPPTLIVVFEVTMLLTILVTFLGFLIANSFPMLRAKTYDLHITQGYIGVRAIVSKTQVDEVTEIFKRTGAQFPQMVEILSPQRDMGFLRFWGALAGVVAVLGVVSLLGFYDVIHIPFPSQMIDQESIAAEQGPRLAAPAASVPIQGAVLIAGEPASQPLPSSPASVQRGKVLYGINCSVCHGDTGVGDGKISSYFTPKPFDLSSDTVQNLPDSEIFLVITTGRGQMPSLAENLQVSERWDVVNYVRTLKK
jgi:mono/diheme cytochrome c family protein